VRERCFLAASVAGLELRNTFRTAASVAGLVERLRLGAGGELGDTAVASDASSLRVDEMSEATFNDACSEARRVNSQGRRAPASIA
jgi:hypothetical protein